MPLLQTPQPPAIHENGVPRLRQFSHRSTSVDPRASSVLDTMVAAYKVLNAYSGTSEITSSVPISRPAPPNAKSPTASATGGMLRVRVTTRMQKPSLTSITIDEQTAQGTTQRQVVCDGKTLFALGGATGTTPARYTKQAVPHDGPVLWMAFAQSRMRAVSPLGLLLAGQDPFQPIRSRIKQLVPGPPTKIDGVPVQVIFGTLTAPDGGDERFVYYISDEDHLARRIIRTFQQNGREVVITENITGVQVAPTFSADAFAFTPPAGVVELNRAFYAPVGKGADSSISSAVLPTGPTVTVSKAVASSKNLQEPTVSVGAKGNFTVPLQDVQKYLASVAARTTKEPKSKRTNDGELVSLDLTQIPKTAPSSSAPPIYTVPLSNAILAETSLHIMPEEGLAVISPSFVRFDFGSRSLLDQTKVERLFTVRNTGKTPIALRRISVSCSCLSIAAVSPVLSPMADTATDMKQVSVSQGITSAPKTPPVLQPGEGIILQATINLNKILTGKVLGKFVYVWAEGQAKPVAALELTGESAPAVHFATKLIDIGMVDVSRTQHSPMHIKVTFDKHFIEKEKFLPILYTPSQAVSIRLISTNPAMPITAPVLSSVTQEYELSFTPNAPLGVIDTQLAFVPINQNSNSPLPSVLRNELLTVRGELIGEIKAQPKALDFGAVSVHKEATRRLTLQGINAAVLDGMRFTSGSPWLAVGLSPDKAPTGSATSRNAAKSRNLEITLSADTPTGKLDSGLLITLKNGRNLFVPVSVLVTPPQPPSPQESNPIK